MLKYLQITFTGYEAKTIGGCPTAEWVIRRASKEELFLVIYRFHKGHTCNAPYTVVSIVLWEGLSQARALQLYRQLTDTLPKYGCPTPRKCEKNERSVLPRIMVTLYQSWSQILILIFYIKQQNMLVSREGRGDKGILLFIWMFVECVLQWLQVCQEQNSKEIQITGTIPGI